MKKRLTLIVALFSISAMLFGCGANTETGKNPNSSDKIEETTGTNSDLETEEQSDFKYDFEGRYWVVYEEEYTLGYYFDGTNVTALVTVGSENVTPYSVKNGKIVFTYESGEIFEYVYQIENDSLYLLATDESLEICCVEVDKAEFDKLFNDDIDSEDSSTTEAETENVGEIPSTEEDTTVEQNNYRYEFEGKYWVNYSEYGNVGYYFDGENVLCAGGNYGKENYPYSVVDNIIDIEGEEYAYEMSDGKLGLCYAMGDGSDLAYYDEVDKAEFEKLFN